MSSRATSRRSDPARRFGLVGAVVAIVLAIGVTLSYNANDGLPFTSTYKVNVELPSADRLIKNNEVRVGGVRVGQISEVGARAQGPDGPLRARVELALDTDIGPLPVDSTVKVRPASILGATYVDLSLGRNATTVPEGGTLPLARADPTVELTDLLDIFDPQTGIALQQVLREAGDGLAGRGVAINRTLPALGAALAPISRVSRTLADPGTRLSPFIVSAGRFVGVVSEVATSVGDGVDGGAQTFGALAREREALGSSVVLLPPAERAATSALNRLQPSLDRLARLTVALRPGVARLPRTTQTVSTTLDAGLPSLRALPAFAVRLDGTLRQLRTLSRAPSTVGALQKIGATATAAERTLEVLVPLQLQCNSIGTWAESFSSTFGSLGTGQGPSIANIGVTHLGAENELFQNRRPSSNVGINYLPHEDASECESGNEVYRGAQALNNPPGQQSAATRGTRPPVGVRDRAVRAGLTGPEDRP